MFSIDHRRSATPASITGVVVAVRVCLGKRRMRPARVVVHKVERHGSHRKGRHPGGLGGSVRRTNCGLGSCVGTLNYRCYARLNPLTKQR